MNENDVQFQKHLRIENVFHPENSSFQNSMAFGYIEINRTNAFSYTYFDLVF